MVVIEFAAPIIKGADEVDAAIRQVNELLGEVDTTGGAAAVNVSDTSRKSAPHHILSIDRRYIFYMYKNLRHSLSKL